MNEIKEIHDTSIEWGCICNLADRIATVEEKIGPWDDLINLVADIFDSEGQSLDHKHLAFDVYPFFWHLYFRVRAWDKPVPFNQVSKMKQSVAIDGKQYQEEKEGYMITNYDYKTYLWARKLGYGDYICNNWLWVERDKLTAAQIRRFDKLAEQKN